MKELMRLICFSFLGVVLWCCGEKTDEMASSVVRLSLSKAELDFSSEGGKQQVVVTGSHAWEVVSGQEWCRCDPSEGAQGETTVGIAADRNMGESSRVAVLTFRCADSSRSCTVVQQGNVTAVDLPDAAFRAFCLEKFDTDKDGLLSEKEIAGVTRLDVDSRQIVSLQGIEKFESLTELICSNNRIKTLDISSLKHLVALDCAQNQLTELDIRANGTLKKLDCSGNPQLTVIRVGEKFRSTADFTKPGTAFYIFPNTVVPGGYSLVWQEEFSRDRISGGRCETPDMEEWAYETGNGGWGNNELQNYVPGILGNDTCAMIADGSLKIIAKKRGNEVISARINTRKSWTYGYFEARLRLPGGKGSWPAFWMMPGNHTAWPADGEIDIMEEVGFRPGYVSAAIHCKAYNHVLGTQKTAEKFVADAGTAFHIYALEWTEEYIKGYVDGACYFTFLNDRQGNRDTWPFYVPFYLKLNLAWGGNWAGMQGVDESVLPITYEIDYVRVFQRK